MHKRVRTKLLNLLIKLINKEDLDILFLTETDVRLNNEEDFKLCGFNTIFHKRENNEEKIRLIALVKTSLEQNIKVLSEAMSAKFPSIWLELTESNKSPIF